MRSDQWSDTVNYILSFITVQWKKQANSPTYVHSYNTELLQVMHGIYTAELFLLHLVVWERGSNNIL